MEDARRPSAHRFEIWASPEPTIARIDGARVRDQLAETGHERRWDDIDRLIALGVAGTRFPVLWEKTAPQDPSSPDLTWARPRLERLREGGVEPIVTLLHHGSGPSWTDLTDPTFPTAFARYAEAVARALPWVRRWTPINEPLTTARFSALYGHWHPNARDDAAFGSAITNQALGIALAMEAIRRHQPHAELVLTEDLQSFEALDPRVEAIVAHKRERRYLSIELVMGRVGVGDAMDDYLVQTCGVSRARLREIADRATPPDLLGWNFYPNSSRTLFTDPDGSARNEPTIGFREISPLPSLRAAHERLGLPFGLSEVHVNADERGRRRWLAQRYADLVELEREGLPVRMLGAWAAFGLVDWDSLLVRFENHREDGVYTFAAGDDVPRPTLVSEAVARLARGEAIAVEDEPGWWETRGQPTRRASA